MEIKLFEKFAEMLKAPASQSNTKFQAHSTFHIFHRHFFLSGGFLGSENYLIFVVLHHHVTFKKSPKVFLSLENFPFNFFFLRKKFRSRGILFMVSANYSPRHSRNYLVIYDEKHLEGVMNLTRT